MKLTITRVLLAYEEPLLVEASDVKERRYIGVNYADGEEAHLFYFAHVSPDVIDQLYTQHVDVRYLVTKLHRGKYQLGELWGTEGESVATKAADHLSPQWLPQPGMFVPRLDGNSSSEVRAVQIDGRWGINDLRRFSDLVQDCYAFVYALSGRGSASSKQKIAALFHRYPWKGGFSSVNFFDDLYAMIPRSEQAVIRSMHYASPGAIEMTMNGRVANAIRQIVSDINQGDSAAEKAYADVHDWLRKKEWLGATKADLKLTRSDKEALSDRLTELTVAFGLKNRRDEILDLASADPLGAVKILLAYYRRLAGLADYVATGKAQELFTQV